METTETIKGEDYLIYWNGTGFFYDMGYELMEGEDEDGRQFTAVALTHQGVITDLQDVEIA